MQPKLDYTTETRKAYDTYPELYDQKFQEFFDNFGKDLADTFISFVQGNRILDVGCGPGHYAAYFKKQGFDVLGIDTSPEMVALCQKRGVRAQVLDMKKLKDLGVTFDAVWANAALLHEPKANAQPIIDIFSAVLKPQSGLLYVSVKEGVQEGFEERSNQPGVKRWFSHFTDTEMRQSLERDFDILTPHRTDVDGKFAFIEYFARKK